MKITEQVYGEKHEVRMNTHNIWLILKIAKSGYSQSEQPVTRVSIEKWLVDNISEVEDCDYYTWFNVVGDHYVTSEFDWTQPSTKRELFTQMAQYLIQELS